MIKPEVIVEENGVIVTEGKYVGESGWLFLAFELWHLFVETDRVRDQRVVHWDWWLIKIAMRWNLLSCVIINGFKSQYKVLYIVVKHMSKSRTKTKMSRSRVSIDSVAVEFDHFIFFCFSFIFLSFFSFSSLFFNFSIFFFLNSSFLCCGAFSACYSFYSAFSYTGSFLPYLFFFFPFFYLLSLGFSKAFDFYCARFCF
jgi:hypothetical protein